MRPCEDRCDYSCSGWLKGIPKKNLVNVWKASIAWSIEQALQSDSIDSVRVTSDDPEILSTAKSFGANPITNEEISGDLASSESAGSTLSRRLTLTLLIN